MAAVIVGPSPFVRPTRKLTRYDPKYFLVRYFRLRYAMAVWYGAGLYDREVVVGSTPARAAVYQCQLSVPSLRGRLMSTSENWGVNGHTYHAMH